MEKKFRTLRAISFIYKLLGILSILTTGLVVVVLLLGNVLSRYASGNYLSSAEAIVGSVGLAIGMLVYGGGISITFYALGEGVELMIALEENSRATAIALQRLSARQSNQQPAQRQTAPVPPTPHQNPNSLISRVTTKD
jgi:hypothetical protein